MHKILPSEENPALRERSLDIPLKDIGNARVTKIIEAMKRLLAKEEFGVALAAVQIGEPLRLFIVSGRAIARDSRNAPDEDLPARSGGHVAEKKLRDEIPPVPDQVYINPSLTKLSRGRTDKHEGCLSIRGKWGEVPRAEKATITAYDEHGKKFIRGASGFLAHVFQHEMDHLEGILYIDKATKLYDAKDSD